MVDRVASFTQTANLISSNLKLQGKYSEGQIQLSSGFKSQNYQGIARNSAQLLNLESDYERISQQSENTQLAIDRNEIMFSTLGGIIDNVSSFLADLSTTISGFGLEGADLVNNATTSLNLLVGALNTSAANRYLFSGSTTQTRPVDLTAFGGQTYTAPGPSVADTSYYQGDNYIQSVEASDGFIVNYGITADNPAFEKIFRAFDLVMTTPNDEDTLIEAYSVMRQGLDEVAIMQALTSQKAQTMELQINTNLEELNLIDNEIVDIREIDAAEVSVRLKQLETQLEASYSVTTDLLQLSLSDFIR